MSFVWLVYRKPATAVKRGADWEDKYSRHERLLRLEKTVKLSQDLALGGFRWRKKGP
jgi:hypothetical protein